ncbi:MAG: D-amino acid dehydrogenase [Rhodospirillales bacterium]|nr:D-amino acid dehydrogenase [Rhodospirillales bacterium]
MRVVVLGAGVIGVTAAYYLNQAGHDVTVIDRQDGPGLETSFANGGQISASHAAPWAAPDVPFLMLKWLGRSDAPLLYHWRLDWRQWTWSLRFLMNCLAPRARRNTEDNMRISLYSRGLLPDIRSDTGIEYDLETRGILQIYENQNDLEAAARHGEWLGQLGCKSEVLNKEQCIQLDSALEACADKLIGGIYTKDDESGDAYKFTANLAGICAARGVTFRYGETIEALRTQHGKIESVRTDGGNYSGDAFLMSLGSYSPLILRPLGINLPVFPTKGYSVTIPIGSGNGAPSVSLTDEENKLVYSRLGDRLRIAGTAEFSGYDTNLEERRANSILAKARQRFPSAGDFDKAEFWTALRPLTPDGMPVIGATKYDNLFMNTGHGTLGWTMCAGSGKAISDLISGAAPEIDIAAYSLDRF